ncbi:hypothetical protein A3711_16010 [Erythrobacter sp. HI00D59]|nr:hypothetical protein A3711_16010 [Erythrobacter sp. HI00D59]
MTLLAFVQVTSDILPISLITPIARDLELTPGQVGQAVAVSGLSAVATSLFLGKIIGSLDRRLVLLIIAGLQVLSSIVIAASSDQMHLVIGRIVFGCSLGGFWSLQAAIAMRLVPSPSVPMALAAINGGLAFASVVDAPLATLLGDFIGWRATLWCAVPLSIAAFLGLFFLLPRLTVDLDRPVSGILSLLTNRTAVTGFVGCGLLFSGLYGLTAYLRPFLEQVTKVGIEGLASLLLVVGIGGLFGTMAVGRMKPSHLRIALVVYPAVLSAVALCLAAFGSWLPAVAILLAVWGFFAGSAPVPWWTWVTKATPENPEASGAFLVAVVQFAVMMGRAGGGSVFDAVGPRGEVVACAMVLATAMLIALTIRRRSLA